MRLLQVGNTDLVGNRFNGHEIHKRLRKAGIESHYCVWKKESDDAGTWELARFPGSRWADGHIRRMESFLSVQNLLFPFAMALPIDSRFRAADLVHYHLVHAAHLGLAGLSYLMRLKPSVWTLHDPWALTGHCIYPLECSRWKTGCGQCPDLKSSMEMNRDHTALMWRAKKSIYQSLDIDIVVASRWMERMVKASPLTRHLRVNYIPFGIDLSAFNPTGGEAFRHRHGIPSDAFVIAFRATSNRHKNLDMIRNSLQRLRSTRPVFLIAFEGKGMLVDLEPQYPVIELEWVTDSRVAAAAYAAADVFLMPSSAEAFGMMAIEAMACGTPVIVCEGTSLPEVVFYPQAGVMVAQDDAEGMAFEIESLMNDESRLGKLSASALRLAREHYDFETYERRTLALYEEVQARTGAVTEG